MKACVAARIDESWIWANAYSERPSKYWDGIIFLAGDFLEDRLNQLKAIMEIKEL